MEISKINKLALKS